MGLLRERAGTFSSLPSGTTALRANRSMSSIRCDHSPCISHISSICSGVAEDWKFESEIVVYQYVDVSGNWRPERMVTRIDAHCSFKM